VPTHRQETFCAGREAIRQSASARVSQAGGRRTLLASALRRGGNGSNPGSLGRNGSDVWRRFEDAGCRRSDSTARSLSRRRIPRARRRCASGKKKKETGSFGETIMKWLRLLIAVAA